MGTCETCMVCMGHYKIGLGRYETYMSNYEMTKHKREIGEGEKGEIWVLFG